MNNNKDNNNINNNDFEKNPKQCDINNLSQLLF